MHHYYWRDYAGVLPLDGISFRGIYIAQIPYYYSMLPAAFDPDKEEAVTEAFGARRIIKDGIKVIKYKDISWYKHLSVRFVIFEKKNYFVDLKILNNLKIFALEQAQKYFLIRIIIVVFYLCT